MPSAVLFSNASFDEPAQATAVRSIESAKRKELEDDTIKLYASRSKSLDCVNKKKPLAVGDSILGSVDNYVEPNTINTMFESQSKKVDLNYDLDQSAKKRKLKIIPNAIDSKNKTIALMTKVSVHYCLVYFNFVLNLYTLVLLNYD